MNKPLQPHPPAPPARGFTAIELLVVLSIVAILATVAAPSFRQFIAKQRIKSASSALVDSLRIARSEAIKRNTAMAFKFSNSGASTPVNAWSITQSADGTGTTLLQQDGFPSVSATTSTSSDLLFAFNSYGRLTSGGSSWVKLNAAGASANSWVCVSPTGRATVQDTAC